MVFDTRESSTEENRPIELYSFQLGAQSWRWTSYQEDFTFESLTYEAIPISREPFARGKDDRDGMLSIYVPRDNPLAMLYRDIPPAGIGAVTIRKVHEGDTEAAAIWRGLLTSVNFDMQNERAVLMCRPEMGTTPRMIPRFTYAGQCQHVFGDAGCGVNLLLFTHTGMVTDISTDGRTLTVDGLGANGADWAVSGKAKFGAEARNVIAQSGDDITIRLPFRLNPAGSEISVTAGCDHTPETCALKFNNGDRHFGFAFVPLVNPAQEGIM